MRLLVVTGAAVEDPADLPASVRSLVEAASEILVVTPMLPGRLQFWVSDSDRARQHADRRLNRVLAQIRAMGGSAEGRVGDDAPLTAFEDAVRDFRPDHLLIGLRASDHAGWQEDGLLEKIAERFGLPLTVFPIDARGHVPSP